MKLPKRLDKITNRELQILILHGQGYAFNQIAKIFGRSTKTISAHKEHTITKLGIGASTYGRLAFKLAASGVRLRRKGTKHIQVHGVLCSRCRAEIRRGRSVKGEKRGSSMATTAGAASHDKSTTGA